MPPSAAALVSARAVAINRLTGVFSGARGMSASTATNADADAPPPGSRGFAGPAGAGTEPSSAFGRDGRHKRRCHELEVRLAAALEESAASRRAARTAETRAEAEEARRLAAEAKYGAPGPSRRTQQALEADVAEAVEARRLAEDRTGRAEAETAIVARKLEETYRRLILVVDAYDRLEREQQARVPMIGGGDASAAAALEKDHSAKVRAAVSAAVTDREREWASERAALETRVASLGARLEETGARAQDLNLEVRALRAQLAEAVETGARARKFGETLRRMVDESGVLGGPAAAAAAMGATQAMNFNNVYENSSSNRGGHGNGNPNGGGDFVPGTQSPGHGFY
jgi:hypothetical protein